MEQVQDLEALASQLDEELKDQICVVKLMRGQDHVGMARMEVEDVYIDTNSPGASVFRVVGRHPAGVDHAMLGLPIGQTPSSNINANRADDHFALQAGDFQMVIHPQSQKLS